MSGNGSDNAHGNAFGGGKNPGMGNSDSSSHASSAGGDGNKGNGGGANVGHGGSMDVDMGNGVTMHVDGTHALSPGKDNRIPWGGGSGHSHSDGNSGSHQSSSTAQANAAAKVKADAAAKAKTDAAAKTKIDAAAKARDELFTKTGVKPAPVYTPKMVAEANAALRVPGAMVLNRTPGSVQMAMAGAGVWTAFGDVAGNIIKWFDETLSKVSVPEVSPLLLRLSLGTLWFHSEPAGRAAISCQDETWQQCLLSTHSIWRGRV